MSNEIKKQYRGNEFEADHDLTEAKVEDEILRLEEGGGFSFREDNQSMLQCEIAAYNAGEKPHIRIGLWGDYEVTYLFESEGCLVKKIVI